ncbi:hypothetical protein J4475_04145, partial [Candidatus Woesearchaeota archaeon]|nr:hypothetical protein [Candidatus Woesearchaeota archaeon]
GLILNKPVPNAGIISSSSGNFEAEKGINVPAYFYQVGGDGIVIAPSPGTVSVGKHFTGKQAIKISSGDYETYLVMNEPVINVAEGQYTGVSLPLGRVGKSVVGKSNLVMYVKDMISGLYVDISANPRLLI